MLACCLACLHSVAAPPPLGNEAAAAAAAQLVGVRAAEFVNRRLPYTYPPTQTHTHTHRHSYQALYLKSQSNSSATAAWFLSITTATYPRLRPSLPCPALPYSPSPHMHGTLLSRMVSHPFHPDSREYPFLGINQPKEVSFSQTHPPPLLPRLRLLLSVLLHLLFLLSYRGNTFFPCSQPPAREKEVVEL